MIVCLACYEDRLAALFDTAAEFELFEVEADQQIRPVGRVSLPQKDPTERITALAARGVNLLICGAASAPCLTALEQAQIRAQAWHCGTIDEVLHALATDSLDRLAMPGTGRGPGRGGQGRGGQGRGQGRGAGMCQARACNSLQATPCQGGQRRAGQGQGQGQGQGNRMQRRRMARKATNQED